MFGGLRKKLEEAVAQINPFDGGKTAATVRAARASVPPARTVRQSQVQQAPAQQRPSLWQQATNNPLTRGASRALDQVNIWDNNRTWQQRAPTQQKSAFQQTGQFAGQLVRGATTGTTRALNTAAAQVPQIDATARMIAANVTKNPTAFRNAMDYAEAANDTFRRGEGGLFNTGTFYSADEARRGDLKTGVKRIGGGLAEAGLEAGSLGVGGIAGKRLLEQGVRQGLKTQAPRIVANTALNTAQGGVAAYNQDARPRDIAKSALLSGGVGTVADIGLGVGGAALVKHTPQVTSKLVGGAKRQVDDIVNPKYAGLTENQVVMDTGKLDILNEARATLSGEYTPHPGDVGYVLAGLHKIKNENGLDFINGSPADRRMRINQFLEQNGEAIPLLQARRERPSLLADQRGSVPNPFARDRRDSRPKHPRQENLIQSPDSTEVPTPIQPKGQLESPLVPSTYPRRVVSQADENLQPTPSRQGLEEGSSAQLREQPSSTKIQQKTPVVNEAKRAMDGSDRTGFGLRESFDKSDNVPNDLKDALGAFGNERTVKSNKELWKNAQQRVGTDPTGAMKYFADNANDEAVATGYALINRYMKGGQTKEAGEIAMTMAERALESGRTTQAYALMKRLTPEGSVQYIENKVARHLAQNPKDAGKLNWNDGVRKLLYDMADTVNKLPEGRERNLAIGHMQQVIDNIFPSSLTDKAITVWKAGLLTSLRTHERNILSNAINLGAEQASTIPGSVADKLMSLRTGKRTLVATPKGLGKGAKTGGELAKDQIKTGVDPTNSNLKMNINHITWNDNKVEQGLKRFSETVFRPLGAEDKVFREAARRNSFISQATAQAKNKGLRGKERQEFISNLTENPTAKIRDIAEQDAGRATFTHDNNLGNLIRNAKAAIRRSNAPGAKGAAAAFDILMPFTQVPSGVASQLYAYSPVKLMKSVYDVGKVILTGNSELQREAAQGFGRSLMGTTVLGAGAYLAKGGYMTGQPKDEAERDQWEAQGIKPNSIKVGDRWYQVSSIGPQTLIALAGGQMVADKENGEDPLVNLGGNLGKNFKDQTFLKGMSSFLDAIDDPQRYADAYIQNQAVSVIPNIVKDIARAVDPNERQATSLMDKVRASTPGLSHSLGERKDSYGQTMKNAGVGELLDLFNSSKQKDVPEAAYIERLRKITGEKDHVPTKVDKSIQINGEKKKLTSQELSNYQNYVGTKSKQVIGELMKDKAFSKLPVEDKIKRIDNALRDINSAAKIELFRDKGFGTDDYKPRDLDKGVRDVLANKISVSTKPTGQDETYAEKYATLREEYNDPQNGWSKIEKLKKTKELHRLKVQKSYDEDTVDLYGMNKDEVYNFITTDKNGKALANKLLTYGDTLVAAGVTDKNKFRDKYGNVKFETARGGGGKGGRKKAAKFDWTKDLFATGSASSNSVSKNLRRILEEAHKL